MNRGVSIKLEPYPNVADIVGQPSSGWPAITPALALCSVYRV